MVEIKGMGPEKPPWPGLLGSAAWTSECPSCRVKDATILSQDGWRSRRCVHRRSPWFYYCSEEAAPNAWGIYLIYPKLQDNDYLVAIRAFGLNIRVATRTKEKSRQ